MTEKEGCLEFNIIESTVARFIEHTRLRPETTPAEIEQLCNEAVKFGFAAVCVNSGFVSLASRLIAKSGVKVCSVVGFPFGACLTTAKEAEAEAAITAGANELDMVMNIGYFKAGDYNRVLKDIQAVVARADKRVVKVIIETGLLSREEKRRATQLVIDAGAAFVKTSTGFGPTGATVADVRLLSEVAQGRVGVKAAGGIRTLKQAKELLDAGATRLGTSAGVKIVQEELNKKED
ncbi:MAG: deoxyribose-phosphate aldolase [candidate division WOR-3 bacterium]